MGRALIILLFSWSTIGMNAQGYVDQIATYNLMDSQKGNIENIRAAKWQLYNYSSLTALNQYLDSLPGAHKNDRRYIVELANRITFENLQKERVLIVPMVFEEDYRSYSPYPFFYNTAQQLPKLFIIDKYTQTFGAYEYGNLVRWGLVSTGRKNNLTPKGRYNFNWKTYYRKSTAAPPGEIWEMYWVFDFQAKFGIHVHQYSLPIAIAASHGCVRVSRADAIWNYKWANGWVHDNKGMLMRNGTPVLVINNNPNGLASHWSIKANEIHSEVMLPDSFEQIPLGTRSQKEREWQSKW